jgi:hypothetical protein
VWKIEALQGMTVNSEIFYNLVLVTTSGKKLSFAKSVRSAWTAQGVIRAIEEAMGRGGSELGAESREKEN